jgi:hypothetical protein
MSDVVLFAFGDYRGAGPHRIANEIRNIGYSCQVISMIDRMDLPVLEAICKKFIDTNTKVVAFGTVFWQPDGSSNPSYAQVRKVINEVNPNCKVVLGGNRGKEVSTVTSDRIDAIILGQGETLIVELINSYVTGSAVREPTEVFKDIPIYNAENILVGWDFSTAKTTYIPEDCIIPNETLVLEISRGCIFKCKFCAFALNGKKKNDYVKYADTIADELTDNYYKHGISHYMLSDDTFNDSTEKVEYLHNVLTNLPFKVTFTTFNRLDLLNAHRVQIDLLEEMGQVGVHFGIETFHEKAARTIGKGLPGDVAKTFLHDLKTKYWKDNVKIGTSFIQGLPYETYESHAETRQWIEDENNLVDSVQSFRLGLCDPTRHVLPTQSGFQLEASKYGFYFPEINPWVWKSMLGPVKTRQEADALQDLANASALKAGRTPGPGGFQISSAMVVADQSDNPKTIEDFINMNRFEFNAWWNDNYNSAYKTYISKYTDKLLKL